MAIGTTITDMAEDFTKQNFNLVIDKLLPVSNMASSRSEENVSLKHFQHLKVSQYWSVLQFYFGHFCLGCLADVIANLVLAIFCCLADVIAICCFLW